MSDIQTWSNTAASNNATPPNGFPEGMAPSTVNDAARELMAAVSRYRSDTDGVNTSAGTNTITLAASRTMTAYAQGDLYTFKAGGTNTGATTLNVDSLGAKDVQFNGAACTGGEIVSGLMYTVVYDGTQFQLLNASSYPAIDITTLEVTNIKAKDGTASMTIANSTGNVSAGTITTAILNTANAQISGGNIDGADLGAISPITTASIDVAVINTATIPTLNSTTVDTTNIEATNIKAKDGTASFAIADSTGIASFSKATIIATTDNTNAALRVTQTGTANSLVIEDDTNPDSSPFVVDASGILIKGRSTSISSKVLATVQTFDVQVHGATAGPSSIGVFNYANNATFPAFFVFNKSKSGTNGTLSSVNDGDTLGVIQFNGADNDGTPTFNPGAYITAQVAGAVASNSIPGRLTFSTTAVGESTPVSTAQISSTGLTVVRNAAGLGYGTGSGGTVTQTTSRTTGVTLDKTNGSITLVSAAGTATWQSFTVTNSTVAATDVVILSQRSGTDLYMLEVTAVAAGSFRISFATTGGTTTEQPVFNFAVIKAVTA